LQRLAFRLFDVKAPIPRHTHEPHEGEKKRYVSACFFGCPACLLVDKLNTGKAPINSLQGRTSDGQVSAKKVLGCPVFVVKDVYLCTRQRAEKIILEHAFESSRNRLRKPCKVL